MTKLVADVFRIERGYWPYSFYPLTSAKRLLKCNWPVIRRDGERMEGGKKGERERTILMPYIPFSSQKE